MYLAKVIDNMKNNITPPSFFSVKGFLSVQIGLYILLASYLIKSSLDGYVLEGFAGNELSTEQISLFIQLLVILTFLFSGLTLFFFGNHRARRSKQSLWDNRTKSEALKFLISFLVVFAVLYMLYTKNLNEYLGPVFLIGFGIHHILQTPISKEKLLIPALCLLLTIICIIIPSYWYPSLLILAMAYITYGVAVK